MSSAVPQPSGPSPLPNGTPPVPIRRKRLRVPKNCQTCLKKKLKCDRDKPRCGYCSRRNLSCEYADSAPAPARTELQRLRREVAILRSKLSPPATIAKDGLSLPRFDSSGSSGSAASSSSINSISPGARSTQGIPPQSAKLPRFLSDSSNISTFDKYFNSSSQPANASEPCLTSQNQQQLPDKDKDTCDTFMPNSLLFSTEYANLASSKDPEIFSFDSTAVFPIDDPRYQPVVYLLCDTFFRDVFPIWPVVIESEVKVELESLMHRRPISPVRAAVVFGMLSVAAQTLAWSEVSKLRESNWDLSREALWELLYQSSNLQLDKSFKKSSFNVTVDTVAAICLLTIGIYNIAKFDIRQTPKIGWLVAAGLSLDLHRDPVTTGGMQSRESIEIRRRLWIVIRTIDYLKTSLSGLPLMIQQSACDTVLPVKLPNDRESIDVRYLIFAADILNLHATISLKLYGPSSPTYDEVLQLDKEILTQNNELCRLYNPDGMTLRTPYYDRMRYLILHTYLLRGILLLHQPYLLSSLCVSGAPQGDYPFSVEAAISAAERQMTVYLEMARDEIIFSRYQVYLKGSLLNNVSHGLAVAVLALSSSRLKNYSNIDRNALASLVLRFWDFVTQFTSSRVLIDLHSELDVLIQRIRELNVDKSEHDNNVYDYVGVQQWSSVLLGNFSSGLHHSR